MILAPNHRQPLNGSRWLFLITAFMLVTSCDLFRPVQATSQQPSSNRGELDPIQGRRVYDPETGTYVLIENAPAEKMDTVSWREVPVNQSQIIRSAAEVVTDRPSTGTRPEEVGLDPRTQSRKLTAYNVAVMLPFLTDRFSSANAALPQNSDWALNFYGGMRLAFEDLEREGIKLNVSVLDTRASEAYTGQLTRSNADLRDAHLIIGPYRREEARVIAGFATTNDKTVVSPYTTSDSVTVNNPNYIQINPTLRTHCEAITRHARARFRPEQIVLVCRGREVERLQYFQEENARISGGRNVRRFREYVVPENQDVNSGQLLSLLQTDTTVFLVPSWAPESFINSFLRKLDLAKRANQGVVVYGMPQWMQYETVDYELYERLNVHISNSTFLDPLSTATQVFRRRFFDRYGAVPKEEAYLGYDVTLFSGRMLHQYGTKFQYYLEQQPSTEMLLTRYEFERVVNLPPNAVNPENLPVQRFENKFVNILQFRDYQFKPANY
ncbi:MAG: ABC transporter substrate-binding protein [Saprospiraceae bacterium]